MHYRKPSESQGMRSFDAIDATARGGEGLHHHENYWGSPFVSLLGVCDMVSSLMLDGRSTNEGLQTPVPDRTN